MQVHFIEDNRFDARAVEALVSSDKDIQLSLGGAIESLRERVLSHPIDFVLIDINRPDSISMADDVRAIRNFTRAPIIFITGGEADDFRRNALHCGAEAVLEKATISSDVLKQIFYNSKTRLGVGQETASVDDGADVSDKLSAHEFPNFNLDRFQIPLEYLEFGLQTLLDVMRDSGREVSAGFVSHLFETIRAMKAFASGDLSEQTSAPVHQLVLTLKNHLRDLALTKKIRFAIESEDVWFSQVGPLGLSHLGVQHLMEGVLRSCAEGDKVHVLIQKEGRRSVKLAINMSRIVFADTSAVFGGTSLSEHSGLDSRSSLHLATLLLGLRPQQVELTSDSGKQNLIVHL